MAMKKTEVAAIVEVEGVHCYIDEKGVAYLKIEDVARGLGFVEARKFSTSGENYIRWERINSYLAEYGYPPVKRGDFIPENIFYLLAMKANNEVAKAFQLKIANEILPSIRRTGSYSVEKEPKYDFWHPSPEELERRKKITTLEGMLKDLDEHGIKWDWELTPKIEVDENGVRHIVGYQMEPIIKDPGYEKLRKELGLKPTGGFLPD